MCPFYLYYNGQDSVYCIIIKIKRHTIRIPKKLTIWQKVGYKEVTVPGSSPGQVTTNPLIISGLLSFRPFLHNRFSTNYYHITLVIN